jgi:hypothetical protein
MTVLSIHKQYRGLASGSVDVMLCMSNTGACAAKLGSGGRSTSTRLHKIAETVGSL